MTIAHLIRFLQINQVIQIKIYALCFEKKVKTSKNKKNKKKWLKKRPISLKIWSNKCYTFKFFTNRNIEISTLMQEKANFVLKRQQTNQLMYF